MTLNILVHPLSFLYFKDEYAKKKYWEEIKSLKEEENLVVLNNPIPSNKDSLDFDILKAMNLQVSKGFSPEQIFHTESIDVNDETFSFGYVDKKDFSRYSNLLSSFRGEKIKIHGCYYNQCCLNAALQITHYFENRKNISEDFPELSFLETETKALQEAELFERFKRHNVSYGIVFDSSSVYKKTNETGLSQELPINSHQAQLSNLETRVHGLFKDFKRINL